MAEKFRRAPAIRHHTRNNTEERESVTRLVRFVAHALVVALTGIGAAHAVDYPTRPVKWVVPYPPGGTTDTIARIIAQYLSDKMGQQFVIDNKAGGGNNIGTEYALRSPPDGYTMLLVNPANGINQTLYRNLNFDIVKDMQPVAGIVRSPNVMEVTNAFPAKTVPEFIAYCKANPGKINMASSGSGTSVHMSGELFMMMTGCKMTHIPYKGAGPALTDLIGGQVHVLFDNLPSSIGHIRGGRIRALAVTTTEPSSALPGIPTVAQSVPGYEASAWFGIGMPKGTPREIVDKLNAEVNRALNDPAMVKKLEDLGGTPLKGSADDFGAVVKSEVEKWAKVVKASGATVE
jgi:tripartite-type tricarboxylate transporter receptor subunit TctC